MPEYIFDAQGQQLVVKPGSQRQADLRDLAIDEVSGGTSSSGDSSSIDSGFKSSTEDSLSDMSRDSYDEGEKEDGSDPGNNINPILVLQRVVPDDLKVRDSVHDTHHFFSPSTVYILYFVEI